MPIIMVVNTNSLIMTGRFRQVHAQIKITHADTSDYDDDFIYPPSHRKRFKTRPLAHQTIVRDGIVIGWINWVALATFFRRGTVSIPV